MHVFIGKMHAQLAEGNSLLQTSQYPDIFRDFFNNALVCEFIKYLKSHHSAVMNWKAGLIKNNKGLMLNQILLP